VFCAPPPPKGGGGTPHIVLDNPVNCRANTCMREDHLGIGGGPPPPTQSNCHEGLELNQNPKDPKVPKALGPPPPPTGGRATPSPLGVPRENWERSLGNESPKGIRLVSQTERGEEGRSPPGEQSPGDPPIGPLPPIPFHYQRISKLAPPNPSRAIPPKGPSVEEWAGDPPPLSPPAQPRPGGCGGGEGGREACFPPPPPPPVTLKPPERVPTRPLGGEER
jgi:hypothetical protein